MLVECIKLEKIVGGGGFGELFDAFLGVVEGRGKFHDPTILRSPMLPEDHSTSLTPNEPASPSARLENARRAQVAWANTPLEERVKVVATLAARLTERAEAFARIIHEETKKPEVEALLGEVLPSVDVVRYWKENIAAELAPLEMEIDPIAYPHKTGELQRVARGVLLLIMPWNFPFALPLRTIVPALMAGNAVVLKPSEVTPRTGALLEELFQGILPEGVFTVVQGDHEMGATLVASDVDFVIFTGSPRAGRHVAHACAERLVPCALELGGKDAAIVLRDADLERAANGIVWGAMMNAGQNCGAVERVYVEQAVADAFLARVVERTKALRLRDDVGPMTTSAQRAIVAQHVEAAKASGAVVLVGGDAIDEGETRNAFAPTVLRVEDENTPLLQDETFGPVLPIVVVKDEADAIRRANASRYGLTASVWSKDTKRAELISAELRVGVVTINNHSFTGAIPSMPWGGIGESGWGVTGSPVALDHLTRAKLVVIDRSRAAREAWWFPYTPTLKSMALALATLRGEHRSLWERLRALASLIGHFVKRSRELRGS